LRSLAWIPLLALSLLSVAPPTVVLAQEFVTDAAADDVALTVLADAVSHTDAQLRAAGLFWKLQAADAGDMPKWRGHGTLDPDPVVQVAVVSSLVTRLDMPGMLDQLADFASREDRDPYARRLAIQALRNRGQEDLVRGAEEWWLGPDSGDAAPLALEAYEMGVHAARFALEVALSRADVRNDVEFMLSLGYCGDVSLAEAMERGAPFAPAQLQIRMLFARALLGDAAGLAGWSEALLGEDAQLAESAFLTMAHLDPQERARWSHYGKKAELSSIRLGAKWLRKPGRAGMLSAMSQEAEFLRVAAVWLSAELSGEVVAPLLAEGLQDDARRVQLAALKQIGLRRMTSLAPQVAPLLSDPEPLVRVHAAGVYETLIRSGGGATATP